MNKIFLILKNKLKLFFFFKINRIDEEKSERFKKYLKRLYDYLKIHDDDVTTSHKSNTNNMQFSLPELIIDKNLVDTEQIYQQLQLYNNDQSSTSINSLTKFFSKCLVNLDNLSFNIDLKSKKKSNGLNGATNGTTTDNLDSNEEADKEEEDDDYDDDDDVDDGFNSDDSVDKLIKTKVKLNGAVKKSKKEDESSKYGIPDGSDSEISDFDVDENGAEDDDDEDEEEDAENGEEEEDDEDFEDEDEEEDEDEPKKKSKKNNKLEDIDSDEVDEDLVDLYDDLGDEKEVLELGKPLKSFEDIDFDREDFDMVDLDDETKASETKSKSDDKKKNGESGAKKKSLDLFDVKGDDDEDENKDDGKSTFEKRQEKVKEQIEQIQESMLNNISDKPWQLKGEITAKTRPQDSLLEEYLEFDHTTRQAPVINAKTTEEIEKMIKQRVKDKAFDDVERKVKPVDMHYEYKKQVVLDQEKSKVGLGDIYEQEYLKQQQQANDGGEEVCARF